MLFGLLYRDCHGVNIEAELSSGKTVAYSYVFKLTWHTVSVLCLIRSGNEYTGHLSDGESSKLTHLVCVPGHSSVSANMMKKKNSHK